ncbi:MAG TPA: TIGR02569 family protein [Candidatus Corynebacterium avicola]|uniref:TIGR02569 family protein n=1 Tax=Candidatus Corynebacterium avicola TaxID=2838527 RepID=A0A9D1RNS4_9CORY|nr:TIGR02569 family protein [Candidatus Corynebacterium avicola]
MPDTTTNHSNGPAADPVADAPPAAIRAGFQVSHAAPVALGEAWGEGWRCDQAVLIPSDDRARATWSAQVMDRVRPSGVSVARPLRSTDGRYTLGGWTARGFLSGHRAPRFDETAASALRFNEALAQVDEAKHRPDFLDVSAVAAAAGAAGGSGELSETALYAVAEAAAWADDPTELLAPVMDLAEVPRDDVAAAMEKATGLMLLRTGVTAEDQLVHGDVLGCTIYDGYADPAIVDLVPTWRPAGWSVALLVVDAIAWANAEDGLIQRWSHLPDFDQLLLRAVMYRLFVHAVLPDSSPAAWSGISRVSDVIAARVGA